ncbi:aminotransferase class I/II-fold pyridoxal phosphate-dependent enzyme [Neobacillus muris]|uniref:aminotransferase class I/II-fold pyridoxal phosphate-dependent enzyme n=1 Tax=Neobacillus muris TaxID=2941334 RepID=UPI0020404A09|nr:aminotransferase class I/II-fold pyridoxal phosphate-dependent enzyme [Neobacillus muris]
MDKQTKAPLFDALMKYRDKGPISFHVPGHKNGQIFPENAKVFFQELLQLDATELSGLDDLHSPEGAILEAETLLAELFHAQKSYFLVNGSTVGNLAMVMAAANEDDTVLVQRNCHKSILNALRLAKVRPVFLEPEFDPQWKVATGVSPETVKEAIHQYPNAKALVVTYPNYYGMAYCLEEIINHAHRYQIPVLVDEAHGAHFISGEPFPISVSQLGADVTVQSAHKTLPAMTMGSFLHVHSERVDRNRLEDYLHIFQSSSPSYAIMASLDLARSYLASYNAKDLVYLQTKINHFKEQLAEIPQIKVLDYPDQQGDHLKVTIQSRCGISGFELQSKLEQAAIFTELADPYNVLLVLPLLKSGQEYPFDEAAGNIKTALAGLPVQEIMDKSWSPKEKIAELAIGYKDMPNFQELEIPIHQAGGQISAETVIPYPPGIPLFLKGETITKDKLEHFQRLVESGARFQGGIQLSEGKIKVFTTA